MVNLSSARIVLKLSLAAEAVTGLAVVLAPGAVSGWLFGTAVTGSGVAVGRLLGMTLMALVIACWPGDGPARRQPLRAVVAYNLMAAVFLGYLALVQTPVGVLLWPAVAEHALVALVLASGTANEGVTS